MRLKPAGHATKPRIALSSISIAAIVIFALAGCGSSNSKSPAAAVSSTSSTTTTSTSNSSSAASAPTSGASQTLSLAANSSGQLAYSTKTLSAKEGKVTINFTNMAPLGHNVTIESSSHQILGATPTFQGGSKTLTLNLKAGTYKFFCSVPGHRMAGMEGTLTVH